jgi:hypothetical protein
MDPYRGKKYFALHTEGLFSHQGTYLMIYVFVIGGAITLVSIYALLTRDVPIMRKYKI